MYIAKRGLLAATEAVVAKEVEVQAARAEANAARAPVIDGAGASAAVVITEMPAIEVTEPLRQALQAAVATIHRLG